MKSICAITFALTFGFCSNENTVTYLVTPNYEGFCVIFIKENIKMDDTSKVNIKKGFGKMSNQSLKNPFVIKYLYSDTTIHIVEIGEEDSITDNKTHVFGLLKGSMGSPCQKEQIKLVSFFIGKKSEYLKWIGKYKSSLDHLDALDPDWCNYYKAN